MKKIFVYIILISFLFLISPSVEVKAIEIEYIKKIKDRGSLLVGMPPFNNPPYYYKDSPPEVLDSDSMKGNDVELIRKFAKNLGVEVVFDQSSKVLMILLLEQVEGILIWQ